MGAGPAGLACAHRLALKGHAVTLFDARRRAGGLNEFGIASYKTEDDFAAREVDWLLGVGGIAVELGQRLGAELTLDGLARDYEAVFLGIGLAGVNALGVAGDAAVNVRDAVDFIAELRQAEDLATSKGVRILTNARPLRPVADGAVRAVEFAYTEDGPDGFRDTGETFRLPADQVFKAIGQKLEGAPGGVALEGGKIRVTATGRTSREGVWAGGDCVAAGDDLVVTAVAQGRDAAEDIHAALMG